MKTKITADDILKELRDQNLARSSSFIGRKAQNFDIDGQSYVARKEFSFNVETSRLSDICFSGLSKPKIPEFVSRKVAEWYWYGTLDLSEKEKERLIKTRNNLVIKKIEKAEKNNLIEVDKRFNSFSSINIKNNFKIIGRYNRLVFSDYKTFMTSKAISLMGVHIADQLVTSTITVDEFEREFSNIWLDKNNYMGVLNKLEIIGVIKRVENNFIPYIAFEIFGDEVKNIISCNFFNETLRYEENFLELLKKN